jgi:radical SAM superfamily enzyme YgiQ (UPF0313 family)
MQERQGVFGKFSPLIPPAGLAYMAAILIKDGFNVVILDQQARKWDNRRLIQELGRIKPDVVGFSCLTFVMDTVEDASRKIRANFPHIKIVLGNIHPTIFHKELIEAGVADIIVRGEGEITMADICNALMDKRDLHSIEGITFYDGNKICINPERRLISDLDSLPYPEWDLFSGVKYSAFSIREFNNRGFPVPMIASRGCAFHCEFCSQNIIYKGFRKRHFVKVADEIEYHYNKRRHTVFGFNDANFPFDTAYGHDFCDEIIKRGLNRKIVWFTETRVDLVDRDLLKHMHNAGLRFIQFGVESGNSDVLSMMNKKYFKEKAIDAFKWSREAGIITLGLFVIGMPGETRKQIGETFRFARKLKTDLARFSIATPYPGSSLWERYKSSLIKQPTWKYSSWLDINNKNAKLLLEQYRLPSGELSYLQKKGMFFFYAQPRILKRLLLDDTVSFSEVFKGFLSLIQTIFPALINTFKYNNYRR